MYSQMCVLLSVLPCVVTGLVTGQSSFFSHVVAPTSLIESEDWRSVVASLPLYRVNEKRKTKLTEGESPPQYKEIN